jgi:vacuolar protein sorting-associated protein IST1
VKVPGPEEERGGAAKKAGAGKINDSGIPELDELTRRFADLKRKP